MFAAGIAVLVLLVHGVVALVGLVVITSGILVRRRDRRGGRALIIVGAVIVLLPIGVAASSFLPGQH